MLCIVLNFFEYSELLLLFLQIYLISFYFILICFTKYEEEEEEEAFMNYVVEAKGYKGILKGTAVKTVSRMLLLKLKFIQLFFFPFSNFRVKFFRVKNLDVFVHWTQLQQKSENENCCRRFTVFSVVVLDFFKQRIWKNWTKIIATFLIPKNVWFSENKFLEISGQKILNRKL